MRQVHDETKRRALAELTRSVLESDGRIAKAERARIAARAGHRALGESTGEDLPPWMAALTDALAREPLSADVEGCLKNGHTDDEIFEVVVAAALGTALARGEAVLRLLQKRNG